MKLKSIQKIATISLFAIAFAFVESSVVVYLRSLYYPGGFVFPLRVMSAEHLHVELLRECATIIMLGAVGILAGTSAWQRFSYFLIAFGVWDFFYYVWLKLVLNWPASILDWDILFLIPLPWIGPVVAPILISALLIVSGVLLLRKEDKNEKIRAPASVWTMAVLGTCFILFSFMRDTAATLNMQRPERYGYDFFCIGMVLYILALTIMVRTKEAKKH